MCIAKNTWGNPVYSTMDYTLWAFFWEEADSLLTSDFKVISSMINWSSYVIVMYNSIKFQVPAYSGSLIDLQYQNQKWTGILILHTILMYHFINFILLFVDTHIYTTSLCIILHTNFLVSAEWKVFSLQNIGIAVQN
jgi:hypothetical protein